MDTKNTLQELYSWPGFRALNRLQPHPDDPEARIVVLVRTQKKVSALVADVQFVKSVRGVLTWFETWMQPEQRSGYNSSTAVSNVRVAIP